MSNNSLEIVHEGWLTKSPPSKPPILRARWRRRWFVLRHSGELPGQYFLEYYTDHNRRKLKGKIDLDQCEQVDAGLRFESRKQKYQFMFDVKTPKRVYYLAAESEEDMNKWVEYVCHVCGLKAYKDDVDDYDYSPAVEDEPPATAASEQEDLLLGSVTESPPVSPTSTISGPYIPISECISGKSLSSPSGLEDFLLRQGGYGLTASMQYGLTSERILLKSEHKVSYYSQNRCLGLSRVSTTVENTSAPGKIPALPSKKTTAECDDAESSGYYDSPRNLHPPNLELRQSSGSPPLHSPATDGESVFTDEECPISAQPPPSVNWETFPNAEGENVPLVKPSASSSEVGHAGSGSGTWGAGKKSGRHNLGETAATVQTDGPVGVHGRQLSLPTNLQHPRVAPPRPPKPVHLLLESPSHNYLNLENVSPQSRSRRNVRKPSVSSLSSESSKKTGAPASSNDCISASDGNEEPPSPLSPLHSNNDDLDEMYDFPRSHQYANNPSSPSATSNTESKIQLGTRHCYTNAAPSRVSGEVFRYDFHHTDAPISVHEERTFNCSEEPISPLSDGSSSVTSSSTAAIYSNLPSPSTMGTQSSTDGGKGGPLTPPIVNRELKPGRKLSDSTSAVSNEPSPVSPAMLGVSSAFPPSVDRKLKPPQLRQPEQEPLSLAAPPVSKADNNRSLKKNRAAPSPTPPCSIPSTLHNGQKQRSDRNSSSDEEFRNSQDDEPIYYFQHENNKFVPATRFEDIQYLDLDLEDAASGATVASQIPKSPEKSQPTSTVYKTVDFVKTEAFNRTRQEVEKDRNKCTAADQ